MILDGRVLTTTDLGRWRITQLAAELTSDGVPPEMLKNDLQEGIEMGLSARSLQRLSNGESSTQNCPYCLHNCGTHKCDCNVNCRHCCLGLKADPDVDEIPVNVVDVWEVP